MGTDLWRATSPGLCLAPPSSIVSSAATAIARSLRPFPPPAGGLLPPSATLAVPIARALPTACCIVPWAGFGAGVQHQCKNHWCFRAKGGGVEGGLSQGGRQGGRRRMRLPGPISKEKNTKCEFCSLKEHEQAVACYLPGLYSCPRSLVLSSRLIS